FQAEDGIRDFHVTGVQTCALPIFSRSRSSLPLLKKGTALAGTSTVSPVRGLRPVRAGRLRTEKAPKPRSSTRPPSDRVSVMQPKIGRASCRERVEIADVGGLVTRV